MKRTQIASALLIVALFLGLIARAEDAAAKVTLTGTVVAVADADGNVTSVKLEVAGEVPATYQIVLDEKGKALAALKGAAAKVTGTVKAVEGANWLTVEASEAVKAE